MRYLEQNLLPDERMLFRTKKHPIIFFVPALLSFFFIYTTDYMLANPILSRIVWIPWVIAIIFWAHAWLTYATSAFIVTNKRIMMREGFFTFHTTELRLATISQVNVIQGIVGQLLDFGTVFINAFGAGDAYTLIAKPFLFQKTVNEQLDRITNIPT